MQRLLVVLLVALPSGYLANHLMEEIAATRRERDEAQRRSSLLRAAALGGRRSTSLDVDEVLDTLRATVTQIGFIDPVVFEIEGPVAGARLVARPVRYSRRVLGIPPGDPRIVAATRARDAGGPVSWPPQRGPRGHARRCSPRTHRSETRRCSSSVPVAIGDDGVVMIVARWPHPGRPPASQCEGLELCAAQAGASLRNAQVHQELEVLKDQLAHEAAHDALTGLANPRRFHERLERVCGRGRPGELLAVLFLDLDGLKAGQRPLRPRHREQAARRGRRPGSGTAPGSATWSRAWAATSSRSCSPASTAPVPRLEVAERICAILTEPFLLDDHTIRISTSIGIAVAAADRADPSDLVRRADVAMYQAKRQGKARWAWDPAHLQPTRDAS